MRVTRLSSTTNGLIAENRRVSGVQAVGANNSSGSGTDEEREPSGAALQALLELRERVEASRPEEDSVYRQKSFDPRGGPHAEAARLRVRLAASLAEVEGEIRRVVERHGEVLEREVPSEAKALELFTQEAFPAQGGRGEELALEKDYELYYDRVIQGLDRVLEGLLSNRRDSPPGSLLDVEA